MLMGAREGVRERRETNIHASHIDLRNLRAVG
jgi:hypothetical protein